MTTEITRRPAADLSEEQWTEEVEEAQAIHQRVVNGIMGENTSAWYLANAFYDAYETKAWTRLGYGSMNEWLASPEIGYTRSHVTYYIAAWREFIINQEVDPKTLGDIAPSKLALAAVAVHKGKADFERVIADARTLSWGDYRDKYGKPPRQTTISSGPTVGPDESRVPEEETKTERSPGPDEGTGDEVGEPQPNLATSEEPRSGQVVEPMADSVQLAESLEDAEPIRTIAGYQKITRQMLDDDHHDALTRSPVSAEDWQEAQDQPTTFSSPHVPAQHVPEPPEQERDETLEELLELESLAQEVVDTYRQNPNPTKNVPKAIRQVIEALEAHLNR